MVALGAGTKFMPCDALAADDELGAGARVRDCHAEVLARRAFKRFLYSQLRVAAAAWRLQHSRGRRPQQQQQTAAESAPWCILEPCFANAAAAAADADVDADAGGGDFNSEGHGWPRRWRVRPGVTFHLYTSSTPCGNAAVKKWARGAKEVRLDSLGRAVQVDPIKPELKLRLFSALETKL